MGRQIKCKACGEMIDKDVAYKVEHITKSGNKQNHYYHSEEEFKELEEEKDYLLKCKYITDELYGKEITTNDRNKFLSKLHKKGYSYKIIYHCTKDSYRDIENALVSKREEFKNAPTYNVLAYMFAIIENRIKDYKIVNENKYIEVDHIDEFKSKKQIKKEAKPTLMDLIRKGNMNGK